jgi:hypothetical protein
MKEIKQVDKNTLLVYFVRKSLMPSRKFIYSLKRLQDTNDCILYACITAPIDNFEDAMSNMSEQYIIGTMRGSFIHKLSSLSESIMRQILNLQLRVPTIHEKNVIETTMEADDADDKIIDFSRPSDYRMKAIETKHSGLVGDDASHLPGSRQSRMSTVGTATSTESIKTGNTPYEGK